ncbi:MAG: beta-galactosidase trimerization domain-containing protein [Tepidisphaeraceae bacterium]
MRAAQQNYKPVCKVKRPGVHALEGLQAIAHGSDSVLYFQWRKSRGSVEKFHGAVVDHCATEHTRVFREVAQLGEKLAQLDTVVGTQTKAEVAIVYDYECRWATDDTAGPRNKSKDYFDICIEHYRAFWSMGVNADVIDQMAPLDQYKLVIAPMSYLTRPGFAEKVQKFVEQGGTFVTTYFSGIVDETDLCHLTGFPGPFRKLCGVWAEEIDALYEDESVSVSVDTKAGFSGIFNAGYLCDIVHLEGASPCDLRQRVLRRQPGRHA